MKRRNGKSYRKFKSQTGRVYWIEMKPAEVAEAISYRAAMVLTPIATLIAFAWAAGIFRA